MKIATARNLISGRHHGVDLRHHPTRLQEPLTPQGIRRVVICGIRTGQRCETPPRAAGEVGCEVDLVLAATTTAPIEAGAGYDAISGDDLTRRTASIP